MPRLLRYSVAASLDGFITDADGGVDWIPMDPAIDFHAMFAQYDTLVMGRTTYEHAVAYGPEGTALWAGMRVIVCSTTLTAAQAPGVELVGADTAARVAAIKREPGRDLWLFGGGRLFRSLLEAGVVDEVEVALVPVLLGAGTPLLPGGAYRSSLHLVAQVPYPASGIQLLRYAVVAPPSPS
jgi:dihydrofolate reductase